MGFKSKRSTCTKTKNLTTGIFSDATKQKKNTYYKEYSQLFRNDAKSSTPSTLSSPAPTSSGPTQSLPPSTTRGNHIFVLNII